MDPTTEFTIASMVISRLKPDATFINTQFNTLNVNEILWLTKSAIIIGIKVIGIKNGEIIPTILDNSIAIQFNIFIITISFTS